MDLELSSCSFANSALLSVPSFTPWSAVETDGLELQISEELERTLVTHCSSIPTCDCNQIDTGIAECPGLKEVKQY